MLPAKKLALFLPAATLLLLGGWQYYRGQVRQRATLQQFGQLESRLARNNQLDAAQAKKLLLTIKRAVYRNRNQARDAAVMRTAEQISFRTRSLVDTLQALRRQLSAESGQKDARPGARITANPAATRELAAHLDRYTAFIKDYVSYVSPLTLPPPSRNQTKEFRDFYFNEMPLAAVLATCTLLEAQVRRYGAEALRSNTEKVGSSCCFCFDRIALESVAKSNTVAPGAIYRSQLFLAQSISDVYFTKASVNGQEVDGLYPGRAKVELRAPLAQPGQPDTLQAHWWGAVRADAYPSDTAWQLSVPYYIVKPAGQ